MRISSIFRRYLSLLIIAILASAGLYLVLPHSSVAAQNTRDCDSNAVINCGALSVGELEQKYNQNSGNVQGLYRLFGISSVNDFKGLVMGSVTKSGQVFAGSKLVATNALTAGRQNMPGSRPILNGQFFERPPSVSFASSPLEAFVKMSGQQFMFAVLTSCGNPVIAAPVVVTPPPKPAPKPVPKPVPKSPNFVINKTVRIHSSNGQFTKSVSAHSSDMVDFKIVIKNAGQLKLTNMLVHDDLPSGLTAVVGSFSGSQANPNSGTLPSDLSGILGSSMSIGDMAVGQSVTIIFSATIDDNAVACTNPLVNVVTAIPNETGGKSSQANVQVCVATPSVTPTPAPPAQVVSQSTPTALVNTGMGGLLGIFGLVGAGAAIWHQLFIRLSKRFNLR